MPLCQLIHKEIQNIAAFINGSKILDPKEYNLILTRLPLEIKKINILNKILDLGNQQISKLEEVVEKYLLETSNDISIFDLVATRAAEISDKSVIFTGDLHFSDYHKMHQNAKSFPEKLKTILGTLSVRETEIKSLHLEYVGGNANVQDNKFLESISINTIGGNAWLGRNEILKQATLGNVTKEALFTGSTKLEFLTLGTIGTNLYIRNCLYLTLNNIFSIHTNNNKTEIKHMLIIKGSGLLKSTSEEILEKFDVNPKNILRG